MATETTSRGRGSAPAACPATPSGRPARPLLPRGSRHLFREGRRRREVREAPVAALLFEQEAAHVLSGVPLRCEGAASVADLLFPSRVPHPGPDPEGGTPRGAHLPSLPLEAAVPALEDTTRWSHMLYFFRPAVALGIPTPEWAVGEPNGFLLADVFAGARFGRAKSRGARLTRGWPSCGLPVGRRASLRAGRRSSGGSGLPAGRRSCRRAGRRCSGRPSGGAPSASPLAEVVSLRPPPSVPAGCRGPCYQSS